MILVIVDQLTKMALFIPTYSDINAVEVAMIFLQHVFSKHDTPSDIISDQGKHFTSKFWTSNCKLLGIKGNLSNAYHPQTDGQTEQVNQTTITRIISCPSDNGSPLIKSIEIESL